MRRDCGTALCAMSQLKRDSGDCDRFNALARCGAQNCDESKTELRALSEERAAEWLGDAGLSAVDAGVYGAIAAELAQQSLTSFLTDSDSVLDYLTLLRDITLRDLAARSLLIRVHNTVAKVVFRRVPPADRTAVVAAALQRFAKNISTFRGESKLTTWTSRIAINACMDYWRDRSRHPRSDARASDCAAPSARPDEMLDLQHALAEITPLQREIVRQYCLEGQSIREIATNLGISKSKAGRLCHQALVRLQAILAGRNRS